MSLPGVQHLPLHPVVIPDALNSRIKGLAGLQIDTDNIAFCLFVLEKYSRISEILQDEENRYPPARLPQHPVHQSHRSVPRSWGW
jgi:hypothetical protein